MSLKPNNNLRDPLFTNRETGLESLVTSVGDLYDVTAEGMCPPRICVC